MKNIVLPLDGSLLSQRAMPYAAHLASRTGAKVHLVRAFWSHHVPGTNPVPAQVAASDAAERDLRDATAHLKERGVSQDAHLVYDARAAEVIRKVVTDTHADVVVMSTHGRSGLGRWVYGSVVEQLIQRCDAPLVVVPALGFRSWQADGPKRVVIPLDGSDLAEIAIGPGVDLALALDAEILLLRAVEPQDERQETGPGAESTPERGRISEAESYLDRMVAALGDPRTVIHVKAQAGDPVEVITRLASGPMTLALSMATHGRTGLARVFLGSVSNSVIHRTPVPVQLIRPESVPRYQP